MTGDQLFFYFLLALVAFIVIRKSIRKRSVKNYSAAEARMRMTNGSVMLDVRTGRERSYRSIPGSLHIPLHELNTRMNELERFRSKEIICYCASGSRSISAALRLKKAGFNAANLEEGIASWNF